MISLTPSHLIQYMYCPRFIYFEYVLAIPQYEDRHYKVQRGRNKHSERLERNRGYLRKRLGVLERYDDQYLTNELLRGKVDEVLLLVGDKMAPLDYKFAQYKERLFHTYATQLYCYAILIEENFGKTVEQGFLVYTRSKYKLLSVPITEQNKAFVRATAREIEEIIEGNYFPKSTRYKRKCLSCTYRNICVQ